MDAEYNAGDQLDILDRLLGLVMIVMFVVALVIAVTTAFFRSN